jgi:hypothetical protein
MSNLRKIALCDKSAAEQFAPWNRSAEDLARIQAIAHAEWEAMDANGHLPIGWVNPRA